MCGKTKCIFDRKFVKRAVHISDSVKTSTYVYTLAEIIHIHILSTYILCRISPCFSKASS